MSLQMYEKIPKVVKYSFKKVQKVGKKVKITLSLPFFLPFDDMLMCFAQRMALQGLSLWSVRFRVA